MIRQFLPYHPFDRSGLECPYPFFDYLRSECPVYRIEGLPSGTGREVYVISAYDDLAWASTRPEIFSNVEKWTVPQDTYDEPRSMIQMDPPQHGRVRRIGFRAFRPSRLHQYEPLIRHTANTLIDAFIGRRECELVNEFALPLSIHVIYEIMGFSIESPDLSGHPTHRDVSAFLLAPEELRRSNNALWQDYLRAAIVARVKTPLEDGLSDMVQQHLSHDDMFDLEYVRANASTLLIAGTNTTANALASSMLLLLQNPAQMAKVRRDFDKIPGMFEESLRTESPVSWTSRRVTQDVVIRGTTIPADARVAMMWASGNRDERIFANPETFDVERDNAADHMAFGHGTHFCLGSPLARLEARVAWEQLLTRLKNIRLAGDRNDFKHILHDSHRGLQRLHLEFDPI